MSEKPRPGQSDEEEHCAWCGRRLRPEERERRVCDECVRKLMTAGLSDGEIFDRRR